MAAGAIREADVRIMLELMGELGSFEHPDDFRTGVLPGLRKLVPSHIASYNEVDFGAGKMFAADDPPGSLIAGAEEIFVRLGEQNPLITRYQRTRDGRPYKWSDMITRRELHSTELYREAYEPMRVEYQMSFGLPSPPDLVIGIALNREHRDFSERDRLVLNLVRAPMIQALRAVERYAELAERMSALERGLERDGAGVLLLDRQGDQVVASFVSDAAAETLGLGGTPPKSGEQLPPPLRAWLADLDAQAGKAVPAWAPLVLDQPDGSRVTVQYLPARGDREPEALLVEPVGDRVSIPTLRAAGLTPREAEVMRLIAFGRTNAQIAYDLTLSPRTVQKHLQNIYEKLGATSRTQALITAWSIARTGAAESP